MENTILLAELPEGKSLRVKRVQGEEALVRRLLDLGIIEGAVIDCIGKSPLGEPKAYRVRGCILALRKQEAEQIEGILLEQKEEKGVLLRTICFAGNPNVGKSTLFNKLTGLKQHTGNWPGKTVARAEGYMESEGIRYRLVDLPGCYSLFADSPEEKIARDYILSQEADAVVVVCDGTVLERNLNLVLQVLQLTSRVLVCVNLMDEVKRKGIYLDLERLEQLLLVPVIGISARGRLNQGELFEKIEEAAVLPVLPEKEIEAAQSGEEKELLQQAEQLAKQVVISKGNNHDKKERRLDKLFTGKITGIPVMLGLLFLIFWLTIVGANYPSRQLSHFFLWAEQELFGLFSAWRVPKLLSEILISGVFRVTGWVISVMLPPMAIFFPLFTILEDYGYLPRIAFNLDRCFQCCHACGRQALTMCMGFGCNAVGVTGCRIISSEPERLIAILTNSFVPCNGRFPTLIALISMFLVGGYGMTSMEGFKAAGILAFLVLLGVLLTFLCSWMLGKTLLKGIPSSLILELPPYRRPKPGMILLRSLVDRTLCILLRAIKASVPAGALIWLMANLNIGDRSLLLYCAGTLDPMAALLGLDGVILLAFILGFPANEIVMPIILMAYLSQGSLIEIESLMEMKEILICHGWTLKTAVCTMLFTLVHWPCATTLMTIKKETGSIRWTLVAVLLPTIAGVLLCSFVALLFRVVGL